MGIIIILLLIIAVIILLLILGTFWGFVAIIVFGIIVGIVIYILKRYFGG